MIKLFGLTLLVGIATSVQTLVGGAVFLVMGGVAVCQVKTPDVSLYLPVPTQLIDAGLVVGRVALPDHERERMRREVGQWMPMVERMGEELADLPNGSVLVSVETGEETVKVQKRHGRISVDVDTPDAVVHVSLPARSVRRIAKQIGMLM